MYKTKLQELCQKKKWALPIYSCLKDGPPHNPQFRGSVSVNGVSFSSPIVSKSSKDALNQAAELAVLHFTSSTDAEPVGEGTASGETQNGSQCNANVSAAITGSEHKYKMQLQSFARSKKLDPPVFSNKREGPPHALRFQATVSINGNSFDSPGWFTTLKDAEHAAAKVALMSLSPEASQEADTHFYKNLLQELAQSEGLVLPEYKTTKCGPPHKITFFSTVEVEGEIFHGTGEKSKKLSELSAAKAAYLALMERKSSRTVGLTPSVPPAEELPKVSLDSVKPVSSLNSSLAEQSEEQVKENKDKLVSAETSPVLPKANLQATASSVALSGEAESPSATMTAPDLSALSICETKTKKTVDMKSYLLNNRFRVYTDISDIVLPKGTVLLPIDEGKWVPVSLEFPNEKISA